MMKKYCLLLLLVLCAALASAQTVPEFFTGFWTTATSNRFTRITASPGLTQQVYRLESIMQSDANILQFNIIADGVVLPVSFYEGSVVLVEAKEIAIQQVTPGVVFAGTWKVVQKVPVAPITTTWAGYAQLNRDILIASFKTEQEFVLSVNGTSTNCTNTAMTVFIDGVVVKDNNNQPLIFAPGSSIYGKGKVITLRPSGTCTGNTNPVYGTLKIKA
jgi:archaellum component FlaF (FlaF/FlaG flagellin family)